MPTMPNTTETIPNTSVVAIEEKKDQFYGHGLSKFDFDLYKEEDDIALPVVRIKYISLPNKGERWKIFQDNKVVHIIEGQKLTKKECEFLRSMEGTGWFLSQAKNGIKSFNSFKGELKLKLTTQKKSSKKGSKKKPKHA